MVGGGEESTWCGVAQGTHGRGGRHGLPREPGISCPLSWLCVCDAHGVQLLSASHDTTLRLWDLEHRDRSQQMVGCVSLSVTPSTISLPLS
jgi:hypothetical protein